ncbi:MAG: hypothetical protein ABW192_06155, partial [Sphingobium sp.]
EAGLLGFDGALLVVSHDEAFLGSIGVSRRIDLGGEGAFGRTGRQPGAVVASRSCSSGCRSI